MEITRSLVKYHSYGEEQSHVRGEVRMRSEMVESNYLLTYPRSSKANNLQEYGIDYL